MYVELTDISVFRLVADSVKSEPAVVPVVPFGVTISHCSAVTGVLVIYVILTPGSQRGAFLQR